MKSLSKIKKLRTAIFLAFVITALPFTLEAQRMQHQGGGNRGGARPAGGTNRSINGGSQRPANYNTNRQRPTQQPSQRPSTSNTRDRSKQNAANVNTRDRSGSKNNAPTRDVSKNKPATNDRPNRGNGDNNINSGNKNINVNNRNVNVNRNVYVRPAPRPYPRPPYVYGGFRYNCYHPYHYHPYRPYYYGPYYNPWGVFVATVAVTAIIVSVNNQKYYYDQGVYYVSSDGGYTVVQAPVGATVQVLPPETQTVVVNETTNNYYYAGTYYEKEGDEYVVVPPTAGSVVENLPEGGEQVKIGDITYVKFGEIYYQPVVVDGKNMYEVVDVEPAS